MKKVSEEFVFKILQNKSNNHLHVYLKVNRNLAIEFHKTQDSGVSMLDQVFLQIKELSRIYSHKSFPWTVRYENEPGIDAGGFSKDLFFIFD